jgi:hypothetical protein
LPQVQKKRSERGGFPSERFVLKAFQTTHFTGFALRQPVLASRTFEESPDVVFIQEIITQLPWRMPVFHSHEDGYQLVIPLDQIGIQINIDNLDRQRFPAQLAQRLEHVVAQMTVTA